MSALLEARQLVKKFGKVTALDGLDLTVPPGQVVAVLGPNGAGKTTFVRMVATLIEPDSGSLHVDGHDIARDSMGVRRLIGLAGQSAAVEEMMTGRENLVMVARLYGQSAKQARASAEGILEQVSFQDAADRLVKTYSGGMRRRLDLGASLVGRPRLLLLDEPTTGLDPGSRNEVWASIRAFGRHRHRRHSHHPVSRRGRSSRRIHRHHRRRSGHRPGHAGRAQVSGRSRCRRAPHS